MAKSAISPIGEPAEPPLPPGPILITGCAGFIGSHLSEYLLGRGAAVRGIDCFTDYYPRPLKERNLWPSLQHPRFSFARLDLAADPLARVLDGVGTVFHLAARPGVRGSFGASFGAYARDNLIATQRLLEASAAAEVARFVFASSSSVYGNAGSHPTSEDMPLAPVSPYGMTKLATEELVAVYRRLSGLHTVGLRYFTVYGPRQRPDMAFSRFISKILADEPIEVLGDGRQVRDFTFVADAVRGTVAAGSRGRAGSAYNIGGGTQVELLEAVREIGLLLDRPVEIHHHGDGRGDVRRTWADYGLTRRELGFTCDWTLRSGLREQTRAAVAAARSPVAVGGRA
jgi:nucleoside-diphosphate-sugar epimerase